MRPFYHLPINAHSLLAPRQLPGCEILLQNPKFFQALVVPVFFLLLLLLKATALAGWLLWAAQSQGHGQGRRNYFA
jgi:hypothetical protein